MIMFLLKLVLPFIILVFLKEIIDKKFEKIDGKFYFIFSCVITTLLLIAGGISIISLVIFFIPNLGISGDSLDEISNLIIINFVSILVWVCSKPLLLMETFFIILASLFVLYIKNDIEITNKNINVFRFFAVIIGFLITLIPVFIVYWNDSNFDTLMNDNFGIFGSIFILSVFIFAILNSFLLIKIINKLFVFDSKNNEGGVQRTIY